MTSEFLASLEMLSQDGNFQQFCEFLEENFKNEVIEKMRESKKVTAEDYARVKVYGSLKDLPLKLVRDNRKIEKEEESLY